MSQSAASYSCDGRGCSCTSPPRGGAKCALNASPAKILVKWRFNTVGANLWIKVLTDFYFVVLGFLLNHIYCGRTKNNCRHVLLLWYYCVSLISISIFLGVIAVCSAICGPYVNISGFSTLFLASTPSKVELPPPLFIIMIKTILYVHIIFTFSYNVFVSAKLTMEQLNKSFKVYKQYNSFQATCTFFWAVTYGVK